MTMQISWSMALHNGWEIDVFGSKGRLAATSPTFPTARDCALRGGQLDGAMAEIALPDAYKSVPGIALDWQADIQPAYPMALSMNAMVDAINGKGLAAPDFAVAFAVEKIQEAIRISNSERRWVSLEEIKP
jgi:predicted dehydrogenase